MKIKVFEYVDFNTSDDKLALFVGAKNHSWTKTAWMDSPDDWTYMSFVKTRFGFERVHDGEMVTIDESGDILVMPQKFGVIITSEQMALRAVQQSSRFRND